MRDAALDRPVTDIDLAVSGDPGAAARRIADAADGFAFELSAEFGSWRAAARDRSWQIDVTALRGLRTSPPTWPCATSRSGRSRCRSGARGSSTPTAASPTSSGGS